MTTVLEIITDSLQDAGILSSNETPNATDGQKAFRLLNRMLDADSTEDLMIYQNVNEVFNLVSGQQTYTIGAGGNFNTSRPIDITEIYMRDTNGNDLPVNLIDYEQYADILSKPVTATIALCAYYNSGMPLSTITFWPVPAQTSYRVVVWSWKPLTAFTSLADDIILPPGYEDYIESNLAVRCCMAFARPVPPEIATWAMESKSKIKKINVNVPILGMPASLVGGKTSNTFPISPHIFTGY